MTEAVAFRFILRLTLGLKPEVTARVAPAVVVQFRLESATPVPLHAHPQQSRQITAQGTVGICPQIDLQTGLQVMFRTRSFVLSRRRILLSATFSIRWRLAAEGLCLLPRVPHLRPNPQVALSRRRRTAGILVDLLDTSSRQT